MKSPLSIVYSITSKCPYNCLFCVMSGGEPDPTELDYAGKELICENLINLSRQRDIRVDVSGGEPLSSMAHLKLIESLASEIGRERVSISISGAFLNATVINRIKNACGDVEISLDTFPSPTYSLREYSNQIAAVEAIKMLKSVGIVVGVSSTLTREILDIDMTRDFYLFLKNLSVDYWNILRFMPVGRAKSRLDLMVSQKEWGIYRDGILQFYKQLHQSTGPDVKFHYTFSGHERYELYCRCVRKSIGILPNGLVTACFWGIDENRVPMQERFILGYTPEESLEAILTNEKAAYWTNSQHRCALLDI